MTSLIKRKKSYSLVYYYTDETAKPNRNGKPSEIIRMRSNGKQRLKMKSTKGRLFRRTIKPYGSSCMIS